MSSSADVRSRARYVFEEGRKDCEKCLQAMQSDHAANGRLGSGSTAIAAVEIWRDSTRTALEKMMAEVGHTLDSRGRKWEASLRAILEALEDEIAEGPATIEATLKLARIDGMGAARKAVEDRMSAATDELRKVLAAFRDGWTAPIPVKWPERHPVAYAVGLAVFGAVLAWALQYFLYHRP